MAFQEGPKIHHNCSSHADPGTVYDEVGSTKKRDAVEMNTNTAYGSQCHEGDSIR